jgi:polyhydroxyalkanoate synthase
MKRLRNLIGIRTRLKRPVDSTPHDVVLRQNKLRLLRYRVAGCPVTQSHPVLLVPSVVNRYYILDLLPNKSVAEFFVRQGFDTFCIDWGDPGVEDRFVTLDDIVDEYLGRALRRACALSGADQAHVLGYCLGGTFAAIHAALHGSRFASFTALAAPISFDDDGLLARWTQSDTFDAQALVDAFGIVPGALLQLSFQLLRPTLKAARLVGMLEKLHDDDFQDGFWALERWGSDTAALPGQFFTTLIEGLYRKNKLARGELMVSGRAISLADVRGPTMAVTFEHDTIAPNQSCKALLELVGCPSPVHLHLPGSHVGGAVSSRAMRTLWPQVADFMQKAALAQPRGLQIEASA